MKKWGIFLFLGVCLFFTFSYISKGNENKVEIITFELEKDMQENSNAILRKLEITKEQIYQGNLLLVNNEYPVYPESIPSDMINLSQHNDYTQGYALLGNDIYLSEEITQNLAKLITAVREDGLHNFAITSGFRSFDEQNVLYQQMGSDYALPAGYSEHNLGLALDVGSTQMKMENAPEGKWIEKNAWKFGFILRYPKDKTNITGIQYEPWHIRYVGLPHSLIMQEKNLVLEEYVDYLKQEKKITAKIDGEQYTITYYPVTESIQIEIPEDKHYEISGDNIGGIILTVYE